MCIAHNLYNLFVDFPKILKGLRKSNKLRQQQVAMKLRVHQSNVSDWENGKSRPEYENLIKLADLFDVSLDELLGRKPI